MEDIYRMSTIITKVFNCPQNDFPATTAKKCNKLFYSWLDDWNKARERDANVTVCGTLEPQYEKAEDIPVLNGFTSTKLHSKLAKV